VSTLTEPAKEPAQQGAVALLGRTVDGDPLPRVRRRLTPAHYRSDTMWGWLAPVIITIISGILNFWSITTPHDLTFDETYYAKDAYSLLVKHYASNFVNDNKDDNGNEADAIINAGSTEGIFADGPSKVVHPEAGKWMIAAGEWMFGMTPLGWRFSAAVIGTLMVLVMCRLVRRLTGSTLLGCIAGTLLTFDALHFVMSRIALLDVFLAFWLLCAVHCLVADRDWARVKLAQSYETTPRNVGMFGPVRGFLLRPWRITAGVCFGLACGTKWSGIFVVAGFGLLIWAWDSGMRRSIGVRWAPAKSFIVDAIPSLFSIVLVGLVVYVFTWMGFLTHAEKFEQAFAQPTSQGETLWSSVDDDPHGPVEGVLHDLNILWNYHKEVYAFHTGDYIKSAEHPFESHPGGWLVLNRPLGIDATSGDNTVIANCPEGEQCVKQILAIGTPVLWWTGVVALFVAVGYWLTRRDWRFGVPVVGVLTTWLPWFRYDDRQIFFYYAISIVPFTIIAVTLVIGKIMGPPGLSTRRTVGTVLAGVFVMAVAVNFIYFYPILTDHLLSNSSWHDRMWITTWI
jgi:dolichyl-phosphate-mannose-protein mannosyltransferase